MPTFAKQNNNNMKNKNGTSADLVEHHENGVGSYEFRTDSRGCSHEYTRDELGNVLTYKASNGYGYEVTKDEAGNVLVKQTNK